MARRIALHYIPGNSVLHRWNVLCKLLALLLITATLLRSDRTFLIFDSTLLVGSLIISRLPIVRLLKDIRAWGLFIFLICFVQANFAGGNRMESIPWIPVSREGLVLAFLTAWRLILMLAFAMIFTAVTPPRLLCHAVASVLKPLPFLPARRIGLMVSLTLKFFGLLLDQTEQVEHAYRARFGYLKNNPVRKARSLSLPVLRQSLEKADEIVFALAARNFREDAPVLPFTVPRVHWLPLIALLLIVLCLWLIPPWDRYTLILPSSFSSI